MHDAEEVTFFEKIYVAASGRKIYSTTCEL